MRLQLMRFRFRLHADDHARYGDGWTVYDEPALTRLPIRQLKEIESTIDMSIREMVVRLRGDYTDAMLAASWVARRLAGTVEDFETYEPMITLSEWEPVTGDVDPPGLTPSPSPTTESTT